MKRFRGFRTNGFAFYRTVGNNIFDYYLDGRTFLWIVKIHKIHNNGEVDIQFIDEDHVRRNDGYRLNVELTPITPFYNSLAKILWQQRPKEKRNLRK